MSSQISYTQIEHVVRHRLRNDLNHAASAEDVRHAFQQAVHTFLLSAFGDTIRFFADDIVFQPEAAPYYSLGDAITGAPAVKAALASSDMPQIFAHFAESAAHRYQSVKHHPDRILKNLPESH